MKYNNHLNYQNRRHYLFKVRLIAVFAVTLLMLIAVYVYFSIVTQHEGNTDEVTTSESTQSYFSPSVKIFRTPYFQFQAKESWAEAVNETSGGKYVYRKMRGSLIEHELIIYVNQKPTHLAATRVLPVNLRSNSELLPIKISENCNKYITSPQAGPVSVIIENITFACAKDDSRYSVLVGQVGGGIDLVLKRPDDTTAAYTIFYANLTASQDGNQLLDIASTFQAR